MTKIVAEAYLSMPEKNRYIGGMFFWLNFQSGTVDVEHKSRNAGKSNYNIRKLLKLARLGILSSSTKLLSIGTYFGITSSILSVTAGIYYLSLKLLYNVPLGFTAIIVSIFFVGSIIMLLLGIIGEYMREIVEEVKGRPNYIIEKKINF
jgi:dolichol-phosphate mannosyltransferase